MNDFTGEWLECGRTEGIYGQFDVLENCCLDGDIVDRVVGLVHVGGEQLGWVLPLLYAVNPDLQVSVIIGKDLIRIVIDDWLESWGVLRRKGSWLRGLLGWLRST